jgi:hypothetical protein
LPTISLSNQAEAEIDNHAFDNNIILERQGKYKKCCNGNSFEANSLSTGISPDESNRA